jgi:hypothetical protein
MQRGILVLSVALAVTPAFSQADCSKVQTHRTPLNDLGTGFYQGYQGGLYPGGSNVRPASHDRALDRTGRMVLLDAAGNPDAVNGIFALISIGNSNATEEFTTFLLDAEAVSRKNERLAIVDCASGGQTTDLIRNPADPYWAFVDDTLRAAAVTPLQVQSVWLKDARPDPTEPWPDSALVFEDDLRAIAQVLKSRFPNLKSIYHTSRIYGGYGPNGVNPEPYPYHYGFAVKWLIEEQLQGAPELNFDPAKGPVLAPWMAWGPYLWADGLRARSDGLTWTCADFVPSDGTHPSTLGREKVAERLLSFFETDPTTVPWFVDCNLLASDTFAAPPEVLDQRTGKNGGDRVSFSWQSLDPIVGRDAVYDVVSGRLSELRADRGFARAGCLLTAALDTPLVVSRPAPAPGDGEYYLVRGRNSCGEGTWGDGSLAPDPRDALDAGSPSCP